MARMRRTDDDVPNNGYNYTYIVELRGYRVVVRSQDPISDETLAKYIDEHMANHETTTEAPIPEPHP